MLSCGKIIGRLPKLTSQVPVNHFNRPLKYTGLTSVTNLWYSKKVDNQKANIPIDATIKPEECTSQGKKVPLCETDPYASCPPLCYEINCHPKANQGNSKKGAGFDITKIPYWELWGTIIVAGLLLGIDALTDYFTGEKDVSKSKDDGRYKRPGIKVRNPILSSLIPQEVPYLLIGGGTAAFSAFRSIKSRDPKAKVLVITEEDDFPYMRPPLSKELWYNTDRSTTAQLYFKQWNGTQRSVFYEPQEFYSNVNNLIESDKGGVAVATGWKVTKVDVVNKTVRLDDGYEIKYDKCLLATGASPNKLPAFKSADDEVLEKVITFRTKEDFRELEDKLQDPACKNVVIIGGGFLGSELACALARNWKDKKIYQVFKEKFIMSQVLPEYLSEWTTNKSQVEGVQPIANAEVKGYTYNNKQLSLTLTDGRTIEADQVVLAVGARPNTDLASTSQLEIHPEVGGFLVNAELQARSNVWVAGDAACFFDVKLGRRRVEHHDHAVVSGRLAGENMTGAGKPYLHQSMFWSDLGPEVGYEAVGIIDSTLPTVGVFAEPIVSESPNPSVGDISKLAESSNQENGSAAQATNKSPSESQQSNKDDGKSLATNKDSATVVEKMTKQKDDRNNFDKGVIFYLKNDIVVGIVLWNIFNRMSIARQVLARGTKYDDLNEVAKLFTIHDE